ncbi:MAG: helix-turn-helix transcriptional regulator [Pararhodobacter sp.]|nr:helix-turn-helix transcriptional regulator [Pararhodobacter sp.]
MSEITNFRGETLSESSADAGGETLLMRVGERVRAARERRGLSRRALSEKSGVSQRYLAQLEAGDGNISIALLHRVAQALDHRIEWLLGEEDPWQSDVLRVAELFRLADSATRQQVLAVLQPGSKADLRARRLCLIGLRGAGKSTLGALLGQRRGVPFVELNRVIEEQSGMPINELIAFFGQEGYRRLEAEALNRVIATHEAVVLAVAGGIVADPETFARLMQHFHTIWVKASPQEHMSRVKAQGDLRPMAGNPEAMGQLQALLRARDTLYAQAEAVLETSGKSVGQSLAELEALVEAEGFLG